MTTAIHLLKEAAGLSEEVYHYKIYSSITDVDPNSWNSIIDAQNDLAMNQQLIALMENSLSNQAQFWTIVFYMKEEPIACACLSFFRVDSLQSAPRWIYKITKTCRQLKSNLGHIGVLFCGLPVPCGHTHIRLKPTIQPGPIFDLLVPLMEELGGQVKANLIVFKELEHQQLEQFNSLKQHGFIMGPVQPMHELRYNFANFNDYHHALRSNYRHQITANLRKFSDKKCEIIHTSDATEIYHRFTNEVYQLYLAVWERSKERLEQFPAEFFRNLGHALPGKTTLTLIYQNAKPIAFSIGIRNQHNYYNLYCGVDYSLKEELDLYFNLFYQELDGAFKQNVQTIFLGQTSDRFKLRLGSIPTPRYFWVRTRHTWAQWILKSFKFLIFPQPLKIDALKVLKTND